jgi:hypothetical protein
MRKLALLMVLVFLVPRSLLAADGPTEFLARLLASDFNGDHDLRRDNILYTDGVYHSGDCDCAEPRSNFYPQEEPLTIVSSWRVIGLRMETRNKALVKVRFRTLATAQDYGEDRRIEAYPAPRDDDVTFRVWRRKGRWLWVDPPGRPWVGLDAVERTTEKWKTDLENVYKIASAERDDLPRAIELYKAQLIALKALRPAYEADRQSSASPP